MEEVVATEEAGEEQMETEVASEQQVTEVVVIQDTEKDEEKGYHLSFYYFKSI